MAWKTRTTREADKNNAAAAAAKKAIIVTSAAAAAGLDANKRLKTLQLRDQPGSAGGIGDLQSTTSSVTLHHRQGPGTTDSSRISISDGSPAGSIGITER